jgi:hypothetical protein
MGLTIHYGLKSQAKTADRAARLVEQMRQLALDLPFEEVGEVVSLEGDDCDFEKQRGNVSEDRLWSLIQSSQHIKLPWSERISVGVMPTRIHSFTVIPGPGSEPTNIGLCQYPSAIEVEYRPRDDARFDREYQPYGPNSKGWRFSWRHWQRWLSRNGHESYLSPDDEQFIVTRKVRTGLGGWRWSSFTKTQFASDPRCGGIPNFLRCHVGVVTLLDRIAALPTMSVEINDEGKYGASNYSDDWKEARAAGREPTYVWHPGEYDVRALVGEVGDWNEMIASFAGAMKDVFGTSDIGMESAIGGFPNFEHLEFRGSQDARIQPFLAAMKNLAERNKDSDAA